MYGFDSFVKYSEVDNEGKLTVQNIVNYFQDCHYLEMKKNGFSIDTCDYKNVGWFVDFWQIDFDDIPRIDDKIYIGTYAYKYTSVTEQRNFFLDDELGNTLVKANSIWSLINRDGMQVIRIPDTIYREQSLEEKLGMEYKPRRIKPIEDIRFECVGTYKVTYLDLDSNNHLNNSMYFRIALTALGGVKCVKRICVEFKKQALMGDILLIYYAQKDNYIYIKMSSKTDEKYAVMRIEY